MNIKKDYDLTNLNTFGISAKARFFAEIKNISELEELFASEVFKNNPKLFLGGGSNVLFTKDFAGLVILNDLTGIEILNEGVNEIMIKAMGGEIWHDLVEFTVERGYWGIENLALIPGTVGAAPMQNIGAYGAELKNVLESVEALNIETGQKRIFNKEECLLGYRDSIFKQELKGKYFIVSITIKLSKQGNKNITYKILREHLENNKIEVTKPKDVSEAVSDIRRSKLPDPKIIGNAGSFFKNVFVSGTELKKLKEKYSDIPFWQEGELFKIPAAWLIEQAGWKGKRVGNAGVHEKQVFVLVNHGGATGEEIKNLATSIIDSVYSKFGLHLIPEVNLI